MKFKNWEVQQFRMKNSAKREILEQRQQYKTNSWIYQINTWTAFIDDCTRQDTEYQRLKMVEDQLHQQQLSEVEDCWGSITSAIVGKVALSIAFKICGIWVIPDSDVEEWTEIQTKAMERRCNKNWCAEP